MFSGRTIEDHRHADPRDLPVQMIPMTIGTVGMTQRRSQSGQIIWISSAPNSWHVYTTSNQESDLATKGRTHY